MKKEDIVDKTLKIFENNVVDYDLSSREGYEYSLEALEKDHSDYKLLENSVKRISAYSSYYSADLNSDNISMKIYRVVPTEKATNECKTSTDSEILLLHGTKGKNVDGILKKGFLPQKKGNHEPCVFLTNDIFRAACKGNSYVIDQGVVKENFHLFVTKLTKPSEPERSYEGENARQGNPMKDPATCNCSEPVNFEQVTPETVYDSENNKIVHGTFGVKAGDSNVMRGYPDLVTPAYLIVVQQNPSVSKMVQDLIYNELRVRRYDTQKVVYSVESSDLFCSASEDTNMESFEAEVAKELETCQKNRHEYAIKMFGEKTQSMMRQVMFDFYLDLLGGDRSCKYEAEILETENRDYQFVLRSVEDANGKNNPKVLEIFKLTRVLKFYDPHARYNRKKEGHQLLLCGVTSDKVEDILKSDFEFDHSALHEDFIVNHATNNFDMEFKKGLSYHYDGKKGEELIELSFVFVTSFSRGSEKFSGDCDRDSDGNYVKFGTFRENPEFSARFDRVTVTKTVPKYLIVFKK